jgi:hypothetical protein
MSQQIIWEVEVFGDYKHLIFKIIHLIDIENVRVLHLRKIEILRYLLVSLHYPYFGPFIAKNEGDI